MAFDLRRIAPEREVRPLKPAWLPWLFLLALIGGGGALVALRLWPEGEPTQTLWFWTCVAAFPVIVWAMLFFSYLGVLQTQRTRAEDHNAARRDYQDAVCRKAGVPLHVLGAGFLFSAQAHENTVSAVVERALELVPRSRFAGDGEAIVARWIEPAGYAWRAGDDQADVARHRDLLPYVFGSLQRQIAPEVRALPERTRLVIQVCVEAQLATAEVETIWHDTWHTQGLGEAVRTEFNAGVPDLIAVDGWLDGAPDFATDAVHLLCVVQLNPLLHPPPVAGAAEAGAILMFAASPLVAQKRLVSQTLLYRPERHDDKDLGQGLRQVLLWSRSDGVDVRDQWMSGGSAAPMQRGLAAHLDRQGVGVLMTPELKGQHDVDLRIGSAGAAAPWLCVALASAHALASGQKQLLSIAEADAMTLAVVGPRT